MEEKDLSKFHVDIAIIGMSVKVPQADNLNEFWDILVEGRETVSTFPRERKKDVCSLEKDRTLAFEIGSYLEDIAAFDSSYFNISPKEAELMSPIHRLTLEKCAEALDDAGLSRNRLKGTKAGIFIGHIGDLEGYKYREWLEQNYGTDPMALPGNLNSIIPSRISYILNLKGPAVLIDTACSSSLVAVNEACKSIMFEESDIALAGGIRVSFCPEVITQKLGIESETNKTRPFDQQADGTVLGEGIGVVVLKRLEQAIADGDRIYSVIKGTHINQDGASAGITAPNGNAQISLLTEIWEKYGIDPSYIDYIEAHGTGTKLGDPIEIKALSHAFSKYTKKKQFCGIGSVKSNIGHLFEAAGVISLIKVALMMNNKSFVPSINFSVPNKNISFIDSPFYLVNQTEPWHSENSCRMAGISSFGFSGTNCHVILQDFFKEDDQEKSTQEEALELSFCFSGVTDRALLLMVKNFKAFLIENPTVNLSKLAQNLLYRKSHLKKRMAIVSLNNGENLLKELDFSISLLEKSPLENAELKRSAIIFSNNLDNQELFDRNNVNEYEESEAWKIALNFCNMKSFTGNVQKLVPMPGISFDKKKIWIKPSSQVSEIRTIEGASPEYMLESIIMNLFGYESVSYSESFIDMGIDSIGMVKMLNEIAKQTSKQLKVKDLFEKDTITTLAAYLFDYKKSDIQPIQRLDVSPSGECEASPQQKRMYVHQLRFPNSTANNVNALMKMDGKIDVLKLEKALKTVLTNHEAFQTIFLMKEAKIIQKMIVEKEMDFTLETVYLDDVKNEIDLLINPFNLSKDSLIRGYRIISAGDEYLFLDLHHIICDVTSMEIFVKELIAAYEGTKIIPGEYEYKDYTVWLNNFIQTDIYTAQREFWVKEFRDYKEKSELMKTSETVNQIVFTFNQSLLIKLKNFCKQFKLTEHVFLNTLFGFSMAHLEDDYDQLIGNPVSGRVLENIEEIIGIFTNTVITRNKINRESHFNELLEKNKQKMINYLDHQMYQLDDFASEIKDIDGKPIILKKMFAFQTLPQIKISDGTFIHQIIDKTSSSFDLSLVASEVDNQLFFHLKYVSELYTDEDMEYFIAVFTDSIEEILENPTIKISTLNEKLEQRVQLQSDVPEFNF
ncbi:beta-ketoacyl synthase N-terminal-like domain-containing protein [Carnobacterium divergens]|uniref:beta-ketoacyl synthase N-terminal-like domain-containing protein n=1 Tax=Carnobacterium divergens TaxID=2748 RepID=UPI0007F5272C|nr:beta-ketoacyl synthase N-terminal-like domain-containing protein [Carnobacterium divergens]SBO17133.1 NRPS-PKS protein involved in antibiotic synthesis [Carnobacterium divergens]